MTVDRAWAVRITPIGQASAGALAWRWQGALRLTILVKATFDLIPDGEMTLAPPDPIATAEAHHENNPTRSIRAASDLAPRLPRAEITLVGHAVAPAGRPAPVATVRLALLREAEVLVDKKLLVYGDRSAGAPKPFDRMPLTWERALGGIGWDNNPLGVGVRGGKRVDPPTHNVVAPDDPHRSAGFGPIARAWPERKRLLAGADRKKLDAPIAEVPDGFDFAYFQTAPADQRCDAIRGGELLVLEGMHAHFARIKTRLPRVSAAARVHALTGVTTLPLAADTLRVDTDAMRCAIVFRGAIEVPDEASLAAMRVEAGVELPGAPIAWPEVAEDEPLDDSDLAATIVRMPGAPDTAGAGEAAPAARPTFESTVALTGDAPIAPALPFMPASARQQTMVIEAGDLPPPAPAQRVDRQQTVVLDMAPPPPPPVAPIAAPAPPPVVPVAAPPPVPIAAPPPVAPSPPTAAAPPPPAPHAPSAEPPRASAAIPFANRTPLVAFTIPWEIDPGRPARAVVVKGTFDLTPGGPAKLRAEVEPPSGDRHAADDPTRTLLYPTDFAILKPKADVTLTGHAIAPGGSSPAGRVSFRFGAAGAGFDRTIAVFGDRTWEGAVVKLAPSEPRRFESIPLVWERAFGGPAHAPNPVGLGHEGHTRPPNLEDPASLVRGPGDTPKPACFAPVNMRWQGRASKAGTYGPAWLKTRWPHFPEDFEWSFFQAAPPEQQLDHLRGDEPFEIVGMHREHPVLDGKLPGLAARCFAQKTTAAGGAFHEVALRLDTATFDVDAMALTLVWRGLVEVADDDASDVAELFVLTEELEGPRLSLAEAREKYRRTKVPLPPVADDPDAPPPANDGVPRPESAHEKRIAERLAAAGIAPAAAAAAPAARAEVPEVPPPPADDPRRRQVMAMLAAGASFDGADLSGADLSDLDFSSRSLTAALLDRALLRRARFANASLAGAQLGGADLTDAVLDRADLSLADLTGANLDGARLDGATLDSAVLEEVRGDGASLREVRGARARFTGGSWKRARFDGAALTGADFTGAALDEAVFDGAAMPEIRLYDARGVKVSFKDAKLAEARADGACLLQSTLRGADLAGSIWDGALLDDTSFLGASLAGAGFSRASCARAIFSGADLVEARFDKAKLGGASFLRADLMGASLEGADLAGADLRGANLHAAETWKAALRGADLDMAIITQTKLEGA
jgi:uncharacterized protein YjbI with pentapeptide repeats